MDLPIQSVADDCQSSEGQKQVDRTGIRPWTAGDGASTSFSATSCYPMVCRSVTQTEIVSFPDRLTTREKARTSHKKRRYVFNIDLSGMNVEAVEQSTSINFQESDSGDTQPSPTTNDSRSPDDIRHLIREIRSVPSSPYKARCCDNAQSSVYNGARHKSKVIRREPKQRGARTGTSYTKQDNDQQKQLVTEGAAHAPCNDDGYLRRCSGFRESNLDVDTPLSSRALNQQKESRVVKALESKGKSDRKKINNLAIILCVSPQIGAFSEILPVITTTDDRAASQAQQIPEQAASFKKVQSQPADGDRNADEVKWGAGQVEPACVDTKPFATILGIESGLPERGDPETVSIRRPGIITEPQNPDKEFIRQTEKISDTKERFEFAECCYNNANINKATISHNKNRPLLASPSNDNSCGAWLAERLSPDKEVEQKNQGENSLTMTLSCDFANNEDEGGIYKTVEEHKFSEGSIEDPALTERESIGPSFRKIQRESANLLGRGHQDLNTRFSQSSAQSPRGMGGLENRTTSAGVTNPLDDCHGLKNESYEYSDQFGLKELYPSIPTPPPSALKKRGSLTSASKKQRVKFDLDLEIHVVPRDITSPTNSAVSDPEGSLDYESPYSNSDLDDTLEFKSITSPSKSLANEFDFSEKIAPNFVSTSLQDRIAQRLPVTPFRVISRTSPVAGGRPPSNVGSYKDRRDSLDMLQMQKFLKQQARDRALGSANINSSPKNTTEASRSMRTAPASFPSRYIRHTLSGTARNSQDRLVPRYAQVQTQRQIEEWGHKNLRRHRTEKHSSNEKIRDAEKNAQSRAAIQQNSFLLGNIREQLRRTHTSERPDPVPRQFFPANVRSAAFQPDSGGDPTHSVASERLPIVSQSIAGFPQTIKTNKYAPRTAASLPEEYTLAGAWSLRPHTSDPAVAIRRGGARERRHINAETKPNKPGSFSSGSGRFHFAELSAGARNVLRDAHKAYVKTCSDNTQPVAYGGRRGGGESKTCGEPQVENASVLSLRFPRQETKSRRNEQQAIGENSLSKENAVTVSSLGLTAHTVRPRAGSSFSNNSERGNYRPLGLRRPADDRPKARIAPVSSSPHRSPFTRSSKLLLSIQKADPRPPTAASFRIGEQRDPYASVSRPNYDFRTNIIACDDVS